MGEGSFRGAYPGVGTPVVTGVGHTGVAKAFRHKLAEHNSRANTGILPKPQPADRAPPAVERG
ncbi:hypothetical protein QJS10_CPA08g00866 [Acorus calamus]|uniref:Uncharacterized protein n=1 Tax=Acorus calamus TaxID=4465 RepID=A0AAV9EBE0_ACOCL|nr:hypothetical protein QJS10_CPA08g00815 [Acorus calamus]KAK1310881.1 hypothetical protein QJS10_CPA08g00866 [Acorus calamus]